MNAFQITGKNALVTGANRGIGRAIVEALFANGVAKIYAAVRKPASAAPLKEEFGGKLVPVAYDLTSEATINAAAKTAADTHVVVCNAGVFKGGSIFGEHAFDSFAFELDSNVLGLMRTARAFAPVLKANGGGALVQLNSVASLKCFPDFTTYCASKAAAYSITQALRVQLAGQGTAVFSVHPGPIATDMAEEAGMTASAEPPSVVANAIILAFKTGVFHVWPDGMARQMGASYKSFAEGTIEG